MTRSGSAAWALAIALGLARTASADSTENVATARELYKQGADALDAGDAKSAAERLTAAWALAQTPVIGAALARAHLALGHLVDAREAALAVARVPPQTNETARSTQARREAEALSRQIAPRIPHLTLAIGGLAGHSATIKLDGVDVPLAASAVARQTNPGDHKCVVDTDDGRHAEGSVALAEGETKDLALTLPAPTERGTTGVVSAPAVAAPGAPVESSAGVSPLVWIGVATAGVGVGVGVVTGAFALSSASTVKSSCTAKGADGLSVCGPTNTGDLASAKTMATVSTVAFIVGGVGVGLLVTGLLVGKRPNDHATSRVWPIVGPVSGVGGAF